MMPKQPLDDLDPFDEFVSGTFNVAVPESVNRQLRSQLNDFRETLGSHRRPISSWGSAMDRRIWLGAFVTVAASLIAAAIIALPARPSVSFAEVIATVQQLPWIHVSIEGIDQGKREQWYSPRNDVSGSRSDDWIEFHDHTLGVYYSYDVRRKVLYRMPEDMPPRSNYYALAAQTLRDLLRGSRPVGKPVTLMEMLRRRGTELEFIDQSTQNVNEHGHQWIDYQLTVRYSDLPKPIALQFRVDAETKLPRLVRVTGKLHGQPIVNETRFDYPESGPTNVYDLGVPRSARLVDRFPSDDVVRILEKVRSGRQQMDDYRAIVVSRMDTKYMWWLNERPMLIFKKGENYRIEHARWNGRYPIEEQPGENVDLEKWWRDQTHKFIFCPQYIVNGSATYSIATDVKTDSNGLQRLQVESVKQWESIVPPGEKFPPSWSRQPELVCRPPLGIPSQLMEPTLDLAPPDGPEGTVLLNVRRSGEAPKAFDSDKSRLPPQPDLYRSWLDPARDYVAVRHDMLRVDDTGKEAIRSSFVVEEMKKSPKGIWYATRFRVKAIPPVENDEVFDIYVEFDVDLSDSLFEPPKVGDVFDMKGMK